MAVESLGWAEGRVRILDQTRLPAELTYRECGTWEEVAEAIRTMRVRGAPAIGLAAALGIAVAAAREAAKDGTAGAGTDASELVRRLEPAFAGLAATRPTAVNLFWALERMRSVLERPGVSGMRSDEIARLLEGEAREMIAEDRAMGEAMARHGQELIPEKASVLTHCNAGGLATGGVGTALAVIVAAHRAGKEIRVYADETRPLLQGTRLTAWELAQEGVPVTLICDSAAAGLMARRMIDLVIVGADRITAEGDVANKVGTYSLAVLARHHGIPLYVVAPRSTIDLSLTSGADIPIEERDPGEITGAPWGRVAPDGVSALNPAFDVTPHDLITAIVTDRGAVFPPFRDRLREVMG